MIFGVDLGTRRVALACPELCFVWSVDISNAAGKRDYPLEADAGFRLGQLAHRAVIGLVGERRELKFFYERPVSGKGPKQNIRTAVGQGISAGATLSRLPGDLIEVSSSTWKKELIGHGHADKERCRAWLEEHQPTLAEACGEDQDAIDATCIALYGGVLLAQAGCV